MEKIAQVIAEYAHFFDHYGNYVLIPLFIMIFVVDWKVSKLSFSNPGKKIVRTTLTILAFVVGIFTYLVNFPLKPMVNSLSKVDDAVGEEMVHFEYLNVASGETEALEDYEGKIVLLNFWGTFCPPCIKEFPDLRKLETEFSDDLVVIAISDENPEKIKQFVSRIQSPSIIGWQENYQWINPEKFLPLSIVIDKGQVKSRFFGRKTYEEFVEIIKQVKKG